MKIYYKIVEVQQDGFYFLFHGINGTRRIPVGKWIKGVRKEGVRDGRSTRYTSGIHVVDGLEEAQKYMRKFRRGDRTIVPCYAKGLRPKEHSPSKVYLADEIKLIIND